VFCRAVESGNLELVEKLLLFYAPEDSSDDDKATENGYQSRKENLKQTNHSFVDEISNQSKSQQVVIRDSMEMSDVSTDIKKSHPLLKEPSKRNLWPGASSRSPLPVTLIQNGSKDYLNQQNDEALFDTIGPKHKVKFNKNCRDHWGRSALFIAMIHFNLDMLKLLLRYEVRFCFKNQTHLSCCVSRIAQNVTVLLNTAKNTWKQGDPFALRVRVRAAELSYSYNELGYNIKGTRYPFA